MSSFLVVSLAVAESLTVCLFLRCWLAGWLAVMPAAVLSELLNRVGVAVKRKQARRTSWRGSGVVVCCFLLMF